jgi:methyl-accepting chemotaxis protein
MSSIKSGQATSNSGRRGISIRLKLFGLISTLLVGLSGFFVAYLPARQIEQLESALGHKAETYARLIAFQVRSSLAFNDKETAREAFEGASLDGDVAFLALYDESGTLVQVQGKGDFAKAPALVTRAVVQNREDAVRVTAPVVSLEGPKGTLVIELSKKTILAEAAGVRRTALLSGLVAIVLGMVAAWLVGSSFGRRLQLIARGATAVAGGDLGAPPLRVQQQDEIGELAHAFNGMLKNLQKLVRQIAQAAERLHGAARGFSDVAGRQQEGAARQSGAVDQGRYTVETLAESAQKLVEISRSIGASADQALQDLARPQTLASAELKNITRFFTETRESLAQIAQLSEDAHSATEESLFVMQAVAEVADDTVKSSKEVVRAAEDLLKLSESLEVLVGGFVLDTTAALSNPPPPLALAAE